MIIIEIKVHFQLFNQYLKSMKKFVVLFLMLLPVAVFAQNQKKGGQTKVDSLTNVIKNAQAKFTAGQMKMGTLYYNLAKEKYSQHDYLAAISLSDSAIAYGQLANGLETKGLSYYQGGHLSEAIKALLESAKLSPGYDNNYYLGLSYYKLDSKANASQIISAMNEAQKFKVDTMTFYYLGRSYYELSKFDSAAMNFDYLLKIEKSYEILFGAGLSNYYLGKYDQAISSLEGAYRIKADHPDLLKALAVSYIQAGKTEEGIAVAQVLLKLKKKK